MPSYTVSRDAFEAAHQVLNLSLAINLFTDVDPPEGIVEGIRNKSTSAMQDQ